MQKVNILFICGSLHQTAMMHKISEHLSEFDCFFTPYYGDGIVKILSDNNFLNFSILGNKYKRNAIEYFAENNLKLDYEGTSNEYELVFTCSDLVVPKNIQKAKVILVQEGMTDPENLMYYLVKVFNFPRYLASTSTTGLSHKYDKFCVASDGYKNLFIKRGVKAERIVVTGIPTFDNYNQYLDNDFPYKNYVLVATSDSRETFKYENRKEFIQYAVKISNGKQLIFKLHPNENVKRATYEIQKYAPGSIIFTSAKNEPMIANCNVLVTKFSTVVYIGLALGKMVYSDFNLSELKQLTPIQNGGISSSNIASVGKQLLVQSEQKSLTYQFNSETKASAFSFGMQLLKISKKIFLLEKNNSTN